ncbi:MAG: DUF1987 domain-containing protein [Chlorobi bacterium]|nr:DUF1987 domain-containing protein [Chlorobiota bacterium]
MFEFTDRYFVESTSKTPKIDLDKNTGELKIIGRSLPEDAKEFYKPVLKWLDYYFQSPNVTTIYYSKF